MSRRSRTALVVGVACALGAAVAVAALRTPGQAPVRLAGPRVAVQKSLSALDTGVADTVRASADVSVDTRRVDEASVRVDGSFAPYEVVATRRSVERTGRVSIFHVEYAVSCLSIACVSGRAYRTVSFAPLRVTYRDRAGRARSLTSPWPPVRVHGRVTVADLHRPFLRVGQPVAAAVDYRFGPRPTGILLLALAGLLALSGGVLLVRAAMGARRRAQAGEPRLDRILGELAAASSNGDSGRRRRALEQLALDLEPIDEPLSDESRVLAWAPQDPGPEEIADLAERVRTAVRQ